MKSAILSIGTELTDGQITNRNAAWLSSRLKGFGFRCSLHLCVPDDKTLILEALRHCEQNADLVILTGGLGPTSDDFTRDVVAEWAQLKMNFSDSSWAHVSKRLSERGLVIHDFQKQQCFFPEGAVILENPLGTAHGFRFQALGKLVVVLPGPPREIEGIWNSGLADWIRSLQPNSDPVETIAWQVLGLGESQLTAMMEPIVENSGLEVGYRVHMPYVEFKISFPKSDAPKWLSLKQKIESVLSPWTLARGSEDVAENFVSSMKGLASNDELNPTMFCLTDTVSETYLLKRLFSVENFRSLNFQFSNADVWHNGFYESGKETTARHHNQLSSETPVQKSLINFKLLKISELKAQVFFNQQQAEILIPPNSTTLKERQQQYLTEKAMHWWTEKLWQEGKNG